MITVLGDHHLGQQAGGRDAFVDDLCRYRCLDQSFTLITNPLATDVAFDAEHARRVVEFFADILADALEGAAASALGVVRLVVDQGTRELLRQSCALRFLLGLGRHGSGLQRLQLRLDGRDVSVDQVIEQAGLSWTD